MYNKKNQDEVDDNLKDLKQKLTFKSMRYLYRLCNSDGSRKLYIDVDSLRKKMRNAVCAVL